MGPTGRFQLVFGGAGMSDSMITQLTLAGMTATLLVGSFRGGLRSLLGVHRRQRGLCGQCGYNLRGLAEARCPECGRDFAYAIVTSSDSLGVD
jgi:hypothetical protein